MINATCYWGSKEGIGLGVFYLWALDIIFGNLLSVNYIWKNALFSWQSEIESSDCYLHIQTCNSFLPQYLDIPYFTKIASIITLIFSFIFCWKGSAAIIWKFSQRQRGLSFEVRSHLERSCISIAQSGIRYSITLSYWKSLGELWLDNSHNSASKLYRSWSYFSSFM